MSEELIDQLTKFEQLELIRCNVPNCWHSWPEEAFVGCPVCGSEETLKTNHIRGTKFVCTACKYKWES